MRTFVATAAGIAAAIWAPGLLFLALPVLVVALVPRGTAPAPR